MAYGSDEQGRCLHKKSDPAQYSSCYDRSDQFRYGKHIDELSAQPGELWEYLDQETSRAMQRCTAGLEGGGLAVDGEIPGERVRGCKKQVIKRCLASVRGEEKDIGATHILEVLELLSRQPAELSIFRKCDCRAGIFRDRDPTSARDG